MVLSVRPIRRMIAPQNYKEKFNVSIEGINEVDVNNLDIHSKLFIINKLQERTINVR